MTALKRRPAWRTALVCGAAAAVAVALWRSRAPEPSTRDVVSSEMSSAEGRARSGAIGSGSADGIRRAGGPLSAEEIARLAVHLEELARTDHELALLLAAQVSAAERPGDLMTAVLRGWATVDPEAAAEFALVRSGLDPADAVGAVLDGAASEPDRALLLIDWLALRYPERAEEFGSRLVLAFGKTGQDAAAAAYAVGKASEYRVAWVEQSYDRWAAAQPGAAAQSAREIADPKTREKAFAAVSLQWARQDPRALAEFALTLADDAERARALADALPAWVAGDLPGLEAWLADTPPGRGLDECAVVVGTHPAIVRDDPRRAIGWARTIMDAGQRSSALATIVDQWAVIDPAAARDFVRNTEDLDAETRTALIDRLTPIATQN
jgi:hypothetical protein